MRKELLPIEFMTPGTQAHITALHFGDESLPKIYIQSSLHADEMPGSLAAYHLHKMLLKLEQEQRLKAHIVLVPMCNPLGLGQFVNYAHIGRFHLATAQNFNRLFTVPLAKAVIEAVEKQKFVFSADVKQNTQALRALILDVLRQMSSSSNIHSMHLHLLRLSADADIVLDLHCDNFALTHFYTTPEAWAEFEPLVRYLGSECQLLSEDSNSSSFDEALSSVWMTLRKHYPDQAIEQALFSATVELRGEHDLRHEWASQDADGIIQYLARKGYIVLDEVKPLPELRNEPHPLEGLYYVHTPATGIVVYKVNVGDWVSAGQEVAEIVNPITLETVSVKSEYYGLVFAQSGARVATGECKLMSISCPFDIGNDGLSP